MNLAETLEVKAAALSFCGKILKQINDLTLLAETGLDGDIIQEEFNKHRKKIKSMCSLSKYGD